MADRTYITANCSFVTSFNYLCPYPASDVLGVIKNLKNDNKKNDNKKNDNKYEDFVKAVNNINTVKNDAVVKKNKAIKENRRVAQDFVKELYKKSITEIVEKFEGDKNVVVGLQELNNNDFAYDTIQNTIQEKELDGYFPVLGGFQTDGNLYPTLGYILPGTKEEYFNATNGITKPNNRVSTDSADKNDYSEGIMAVRDLGSDNKLTGSTGSTDFIVKDITFYDDGYLKLINDDGRPVSMVVKKRTKPKPSKSQPSKSQPSKSQPSKSQHSKSGSIFGKVANMLGKKPEQKDSYSDSYSDSDSDSDIASFIYINSHMLNPSLLKKVNEEQLKALRTKGRECILKFIKDKDINLSRYEKHDTFLQINELDEITANGDLEYKEMLKDCAKTYMSEIKTLLQQGDMDTWYTYCQKRFQECITDIVDKCFPNLEVDEDTVVVFFGDFNDPTMHLKKNKLSCEIKGRKYEMNIIYDPDTTCCPNKNSVSIKSGNGYVNNSSEEPYNETFSFAMNDSKLDEMFTTYGNFDTPAFTGDYIGVGTNNIKKHFPGVSTDYFDGGSDHKFVKVTFYKTNIPEGGKRRRTRRKNKNAKKTNKKGKSKKYRKKGRKTRKIRRRK